MGNEGAADQWSWADFQDPRELEVSVNEGDAGREEEGWDLVAEEEAPRSPGSPASSLFPGLSEPSVCGQSRKRGRPPGIRGSHAYRRSLREAQAQGNADGAHSQRAASERAVPARKARQEKMQAVKLARASSSNSIVPAGAGVAEGQLVPLIRDSDASARLGSALQCRALNAALSTFSQGIVFAVGPAAPNDPMAKFASELLPAAPSYCPSLRSESREAAEATEADRVLDHFFHPYRTYNSMTTDADRAGVTRTQVRREIIRSAACMHLLTYKLWGNMFSRIHNMVRAGSTHLGLMVAVCFRFDETPMKIPLKDFLSLTMSISGKADEQLPRLEHSKQKQLCKVLQTEVMVAALLQHKETGQTVLMSGAVPIPLQILERQTAKTYTACLEDCMKFPGLEAAACSFRHKMFVFCTDEFSSNDLSQFGLQARHPGWARIPSLCDVHKASTIQGRVFDLSGLAISGAINFALSMLPSGSLGRLQQMLRKVIADKFSPGWWCLTYQLIRIVRPTSKRFAIPTSACRQRLKDQCMQVLRLTNA